MSKKENEETYQYQVGIYDAFIKLVKWSIIALVVVMVALYFIIKP